MSFVSSIKHSLKMFHLSEKSMKELAEDKQATGWGIIFIVLAGLAVGIGMLQLFTRLPTSIIFGAPLLFLIISFIGIAVLYFFSEFLGGKGAFVPYYRAYSHMYLYNIVAIIPVVGFFLSAIVGVWQIIIAVYITKEVRHMTLAKAAIVVLVPTVIIIVLAVATSLAVSFALFGKYFMTFLQPIL